MSLWIFGDSFTDQYTPVETWMKQVADRLEQKPNYYGQRGSSLAYTYEKFNEVREQIQPNDIVIIAPTDLARRWFFRERHQQTAWASIDERGPTSKAIREYVLYLEDEKTHLIYLMNFLYNVNYLAKTRNVKTVILPCFDWLADELYRCANQFPDIHIAKGCLVRVSVNELEEGQINNMTMLARGVEFRMCHLIKSNHDILANKIVNYIKNNEAISLEQDFIKHVVTPRILSTVEYSKAELFNVHEQPFYNKLIEELRKCKW